MRFQVKRAKGKQRFYWRLVASNGKVLASSETYARRKDCLHAIEVVQHDAWHAAVEVDE
jgi:hypothetical protein